MEVGSQRRFLWNSFVGTSRTPHGEALRLLAIGLVAGVIAAQFLTRLIASLLFGVGATDVPTHLVVCAVLATVTLLASYLPARRATRVDPIVALRTE